MLLGCFKFLSHWGEKIYDPQLTIEKCFEYCRQRSARIAGLYGGHHKCICDDGFPAEKHRAADEQCTDSCKGDLENIGGCGGNYRMSLYLVAEKNTNTPVL